MTGGKESIIFIKGGVTNDKATSSRTILRTSGQQRLLKVVTLGLNVEDEIQGPTGEEHVANLSKCFEETFLDGESDDEWHCLEETHAYQGWEEEKEKEEKG